MTTASLTEACNIASRENENLEQANATTIRTYFASDHSQGASVDANTVDIRFAGTDTLRTPASSNHGNTYRLLLLRPSSKTFNSQSVDNTTCTNKSKILDAGKCM